MAGIDFSFFGRVMIWCWKVKSDATEVQDGLWWVEDGWTRHRARKKLRREATKGLGGWPALYRGKASHDVTEPLKVAVTPICDGTSLPQFIYLLGALSTSNLVLAGWVAPPAHALFLNCSVAPTSP